MQQRAPGLCQSWMWQTTCSIARSIIHLRPGKLHLYVTTCSYIHLGVYWVVAREDLTEAEQHTHLSTPWAAAAAGRGVRPVPAVS